MKSAKYLIMIDYAKVPKLEYKYTECKTLVEAMEAADRMKDESIEPIYLLKVMERTGKAEKLEGGVTEYQYKAVMCRRSVGWHVNNDHNGETNDIMVVQYWRNTWWTA